MWQIADRRTHWLITITQIILRGGRQCLRKMTAHVACSMYTYTARNLYVAHRCIIKENWSGSVEELSFKVTCQGDVWFLRLLKLRLYEGGEREGMEGRGGKGGGGRGGRRRGREERGEGMGGREERGKEGGREEEEMGGGRRGEEGGGRVREGGREGEGEAEIKVIQEEYIC